ncbi:MAG TPA: hypothetical protein VK821_21570 [Dehalococcoidia bacterium]|nr:hypothetical protein [Dehalococcoidia bacterium]
MRRTFLMTLAGITALGSVLLAPASRAAAVASASVPPRIFRPPTAQGALVATPEAAVAHAVQAQNAVYSGDCAAAISPEDLGKLCSKFVAQNGTLRAYLVGRTFSEFSQWVFIQQSADGWRPVIAAPFDGTALAPQIPWPDQSLRP